MILLKFVWFIQRWSRSSEDSLSWGLKYQLMWGEWCFGRVLWVFKAWWSDWVSLCLFISQICRLPSWTCSDLDQCCSWLPLQLLPKQFYRALLIKLPGWFNGRPLPSLRTADGCPKWQAQMVVFISAKRKCSWWTPMPRPPLLTAFIQMKFLSKISPLY